MLTQKAPEPSLRAFNQTLAFAFSMLALGPSAAASFDCNKANSKVERMVCAHPELSELDDELSTTYRAAKSMEMRSPMIAERQRKWLVENRNRCADVSCIRNAYNSQLSWLNERLADPNQNCGVHESQLIGHWSRDSNGDFEEFYIATDKGERTFASWLHNSPEYLGTWNLKGCALHIENDNKQVFSLDFNVVGLKNGVLYLRDSDEGTSSSYRRLKK